MYELDYAPHEALGRAARKLASGGALYLGGGVGVERVDDKDDSKRFAVSSTGTKGTTYIGPLTAVTRAYELAGQSTEPDSPGGTTSIKSPATAARVRELDASAGEKRRQLDRYRREDKRSRPVFLGSSYPSDDSWRARRIPELEAELSAIAAERKRLLGGDLSEAAEVGKPGTNWKQVGPAAKAKLKGILQHYRKEAHPFTACVRDNTKRFGAEGAKRVCAVVKDLNMKTTKWRKGGKGKVSEEAELLLDEACARLAGIDETLGEGAVFQLCEGDHSPELTELAEAVWADVGLLALAGHPMAAAVVEIDATDQARHRDGQWTNVLDRVRKSGEEKPELPRNAEPEGDAPAQESVVDSLLAGRG